MKKPIGKKAIEMSLTALELGKNRVLETIFSHSVKPDRDITAMMDAVKTHGYAFIPSFYPAETCRRIVEEIDGALLQFPEKVWTDDVGSDQRLWGLNRVNALVREFYEHPLNVRLREAYYGLEDSWIEGFTMAGRIESKVGNQGSGGGWHRDSVHMRQFKTLLYLTDVDEVHGPYQYLRGTQHKASVIEGIARHNFTYNHNRLTESDIHRLMENQDYKLDTLTGPAGSLVITDTSGVHRGKPIEKGVRYALTNYYFVHPQKGGKGIPKNIVNLLLA